ncbi:peptidylprolyl isomerase [Butyrivibrio sp. INlla14]|uniref:peptidylprolyl isomerase n=1 Tax=Butyrivibrio sp. INlla14 TaxID=1520808 RepID=UPI001FA7F9B8|nr:peptidylprolyl isomerase [Butyrivibrio sp. INlla14]
MALLITSLFGLSGCGLSEGTAKVVFTTGFSNNEVFRIEDSVCSIQEVMVYLINTQNGYESTFGSQIWEAQTDQGTVSTQLKESVLAKLAQIKAMNLLAADMGITLDESELQNAKEAAAAYYDTLNQSDVDAMYGATEDTIFQVYSEYALADKVYDYIIRDINPEISDDEARTITVEQIFLKTYSLNAAGEKVPFNESEKNTTYLKATSIKNQLIEGSTFEELMTNYNEAEESTISFGKGEMDEAYEQAAFNLGTDEVSGIVETSDGYVIIKCISTFNREQTEYNKVRIVAERKREVFGEKYDAFVDTLTKELNEELWDSIEVTSNEAVTTSDLWKVYDVYFK